jgi:hypothetical protein
MPSQNDYTSYPIGTRIEGVEGEIQICPHCGKNGLANLVDGKMVYTHSQSYEFNEHQEFTFKVKSCPY